MFALRLPTSLSLLAFLLAAPAGAQVADYGDAMDPTFPSLAASGGVRHLDVNNEWLGPAGSPPTVEADSLQIDADADDASSFIVDLAGDLFVITQVTIAADPATTRFLNVLVDADGNASWDGSPDEWIVQNFAFTFDDLLLTGFTTGWIVLGFESPAALMAADYLGRTMRVTLSTESVPDGLGAWGTLARGETEDVSVAAAPIIKPSMLTRFAKFIPRYPVPRLGLGVPITADRVDPDAYLQVPFPADAAAPCTFTLEVTRTSDDPPDNPYGGTITFTGPPPFTAPLPDLADGPVLLGPITVPCPGPVGRVRGNIDGMFDKPADGLSLFRWKVRMSYDPAGIGVVQDQGQIVVPGGFTNGTAGAAFFLANPLENSLADPATAELLPRNDGSLGIAVLGAGPVAESVIDVPGVFPSFAVLPGATSFPGPSGPLAFDVLDDVGLVQRRDSQRVFVRGLSGPTPTLAGWDFANLHFDVAEAAGNVLGCGEILDFQDFDCRRPGCVGKAVTTLSPACVLRSIGGQFQQLTFVGDEIENALVVDVGECAPLRSGTTCVVTTDPSALRLAPDTLGPAALQTSLVYWPIGSAPSPVVVVSQGDLVDVGTVESFEDLAAEEEFVAFESDLAGGEAVFSGDVELDDLRLVVQTGDPLPDSGGALVGSIQRGDVNEAGHVLIALETDDGRRGLYLDIDGVLYKIFLDGDAIPGSAAETFSSGPRCRGTAMALNNADEVVFLAEKNGFEMALFKRAESGSVVQVAADSEPAPGTGGGVFDFGSEILADTCAARLGEDGSVAFTAGVLGGSQPRGIFRLVPGEVEGVPALPPAAVLLVVAVPGLVAAARRLRRRLRASPKGS